MKTAAPSRVRIATAKERRREREPARPVTVEREQGERGQ
jgi:hypothetical protein